jgi:hypothetical protein
MQFSDVDGLLSTICQTFAAEFHEVSGPLLKNSRFCRLALETEVKPTARSSAQSGSRLDASGDTTNMQIKSVSEVLQQGGLALPSLNALKPNVNNYRTLLFQPRGDIEAGAFGVRHKTLLRMLMTSTACHFWTIFVN